ncbi:MAG: hypothetical protein CME36_15170 [unclassified Hahellaceae]|nr:hypothetical protein [Hahellaceae bacterium]|tara:strand:+ start:55339 stop:57378 length:2040 start_codon:yes stop_codon:yes gene_type:complete
MYKLVTVDIWDTLLRRKCHPEFVKKHTALYCYYRFGIGKKPQSLSPDQLYEQRLQVESELAEAAVAQGHDNEYAIADVVRLWLARALQRPEDTLPATDIDCVVNQEFLFELEYSYVDEDILQLLSEIEAEQFVYLSDFYIGAEIIQRLLEAKGLANYFSSGFVSCDHGLNKRSGRFYEFVHERFNVAPGDHLHIGDNFYSDIESAKRYGITTIHYEPERGHSARLKKEEVFLNFPQSFRFPAHKLEPDSSPAEETALAGYRAAELFIGFALFVAEKALANNVDVIYFLTREGEFFQQVFEATFPDRTFAGLPLPQIELLEVSRLSTYPALLDSINVDEFMNIWRLHSVQGLQGLFELVGLNIEHFSSLIATLGFTKGEVIPNPAEDQRLLALFEDTQFHEAAVEAVKQNKKLLAKYLEQKGLTSVDRAALIDVGWRGTIADNIAKLVPSTEFTCVYLGIRKFINPQPENVTKVAYGFDERQSIEYSRLYESFAALEFLCTPESGSVMSYFEDAEGVILPKRQPNATHASPEASFIPGFQAGVVSAAKAFAEPIRMLSLTAEQLHSKSMAVWGNLASSPSNDLVRAFLSMPQQDGLGYGANFDRQNVPSASTILKSAYHKRSRFEVLQYVKRVQWTESVKQVQGIDPFHKYLLLNVFRSANLYRRLRLRLRQRKTSSSAK